MPHCVSEFGYLHKACQNLKFKKMPKINVLRDLQNVGVWSFICKYVIYIF